MEIWKDIFFVENGITFDYRGIYQISNLGRVKSLKFDKERILKSGVSKKGYLYVYLCKNGKQKYFKVHRLVAIMFIENPDKLPEVNHKNEDKTCNEYWNLEWCTTLYNIRYSSAKKINQYDLEGNFVKTWDSISDVKRSLRIYNIDSCCKGKRKTAGKYIWKYYEDAN